MQPRIAPADICTWTATQLDTFLLLYGWLCMIVGFVAGAAFLGFIFVVLFTLRP